MPRQRFECNGCKTAFPLSELHIDPNTSEWYCDPCYSQINAERLESWDDDDE